MGVGLLLIEILPLVVALVLYVFMQKMGYKKVWQKFLIMIVAVLLFMIMSEPMYRNPGLDSWAYLYRDVPWTVILGWADIFLASVLLVDKAWSKLSEKTKFWLYLVVATVITVPIESMLLDTGLRTYAPDLTSTFSGIMIPLTQTPIEVLLAVPMIGALVIGFYKYLSK